MFDDDDPDRPSDAPLPERPMTLAIAALWSLVATAGWFLLVTLTVSFRPAASTDIVNGVACTAAAYVLCIYLIARTHGGERGLADLLGLRTTHPLMYVWAAGLGVVLQVPAELMQRAIERRWPTPPQLVLDQMAALRLDTLGRRVTVAVVIACVGPLIEELLFRGALQRGLRRMYSNSLVVPLVAGLFALGHLQPRLVPPIFVIGLFLGLVRACAGSLLPAVVAHMSFNAVVVIGVMTGRVSVEPQTGPMPMWMMVAGLAGTAAISALMLATAKWSERAERARQEDVA